MADGRLGKAVMVNEMSHSDEHNQNLSKTTKLRKRKVPEDASASNKKKKKINKTTLTTDGSKGAAEVLTALRSPTSKAKVGLRQPPTSQANDIHGSIHPPAHNSVHEVPTDGDQGDGVNLAANSIHQSGSNSATPLPVAADADVGSASRSPTLAEMLGNCSFLQPTKQSTAAAVVDVERYKVKQEYAATAQNIFNKYGDIVADTSFKGSLLVHLLENVCLIYKKLENSEFTGLNIKELEAISIDLHDFQEMNVNVGWLLIRLQDILNGKKVLQALNQELLEANEKFKHFLEKSLVDGI
ncbi:unnamed protein product [Rhodiola kirilowii]